MNEIVGITVNNLPEPKFILSLFNIKNPFFIYSLGKLNEKLTMRNVIDYVDTAFQL